jgi:hypothetical protein
MFSMRRSRGVRPLWAGVSVAAPVKRKSKAARERRLFLALNWQLLIKTSGNAQVSLEAKPV